MKNTFQSKWFWLFLLSFIFNIIIGFVFYQTEKPISQTYNSHDFESIMLNIKKGNEALRNQISFSKSMIHKNIHYKKDIQKPISKMIQDVKNHSRKITKNIEQIQNNIKNNSKGEYAINLEERLNTYLDSVCFFYERTMYETSQTTKIRGQEIKYALQYIQEKSPLAQNLKRDDWLNFNLKNKTHPSILITLEKIKENVLLTELLILKDIEKLSYSREIVINKFMPVFKTKKDKYKQGDVLEADISIATFSKGFEKTAVAIINDEEILFDPSGVAHFKTPLKEKGEQSFYIKIRVVNPLSGEYMTGGIEQTVLVE